MKCNITAVIDSLEQLRQRATRHSAPPHPPKYYIKIKANIYTIQFIYTREKNEFKMSLKNYIESYN